ncbi:hypothetical protein KIW84_022338 [Lathyrus oleraceus]|uniref:Helitron helicase-like domain-containing protein n=1 Tax=Pisum sativum TaxID=3888 RepID=A0A9D4YEQ3_PEA|nr:hypothetical protein KIW84_022338 [Pisum sativum]
MAICSKVGFPDLFITYTCNPNWLEIQRTLLPINLKPPDKPDIIARFFKTKFDNLLANVTKKGVLGKVLAYMYTIEFQKRGLPHAHLLIFLHPSNKYLAPEYIDKIIFAEVPDPVKQPKLYGLVKNHMVHGSCGMANPKCSCMTNGRCSKYYPKKFQDVTLVHQDGYLAYRRRDNDFTIEKNGIMLHSDHVVPHNPYLLMKISAVIVPSAGGREGNYDEIKQYLDCRYVSPSEACWRIFSYSIHGRKPAVGRLFFHLEGENSIYYKDFEQIGNVLLKVSVTESMFTAWFVANQVYDEAKLLTYGQLVSKFVYVKRNRCWRPRKRGYTIGRLIWVPPTTGELYYMWMLLIVKKGPTSYDRLKNIKGFKHATFR